MHPVNPRPPHPPHPPHPLWRRLSLWHRRSAAAAPPAAAAAVAEALERRVCLTAGASGPAPAYVFTDLSPLGSGLDTRPGTINRLGQVAGTFVPGGASEGPFE